ncbi:hypothetical protein BDA96_08G105400 [Sorghum bicolor]|uniref:Uncharacterized protein n=1 Tax=Sorghum bicolor TaxID=4558 RepID=A0A921QFC2_SORBI|nr:hypothetical protein BDA96_08G105400 [Sorghum bicolor]
MEKSIECHEQDMCCRSLLERHNRSSELSVVEPLQRLAIHAVCVLLRSESCRAYAGHHPS